MLEIFNCAQNTPEWYAARLGIPTASQFHAILAQGQGKVRRKYMMELIGERLTGDNAASFSNVHTERGHTLESDARELYSFETIEPIVQVGFVRRGQLPFVVGCSPDALVGYDGVLEIKTKLAHLQLEVLDKGAVPAEHVAQCQGALWVTQRKWLDFVSYWPGLPLFIKRVYPDVEYIAKLETAVQEFIQEMCTLVSRLPPVPATRLPRKVTQIESEFTSLE
jgi:hypothetical protein